MASGAEVAAMRRALALAADGLGHTNPNPVVGAVVLAADGRQVGEGRHERAGGPHAEVIALGVAGPRARGGTVVVTLEPCRHTGRTGPCTRALLAAGVSRVVYGVADPHLPAGGGAAELVDAGVEVEGGVLAERAEALLGPWLAAVRRGRPYLTWKYAATLDGRTAAADGGARWISGPHARADAHRLRALADAVLVGSGTVVADDPELSVRHVEHTRQPTRVIVDTRARIPVDARVLDGQQPTLVAVGVDSDPDAVKALRTRPVEVLELPTVDGHVDLAELFAALYQREQLRVLLEGGAGLAAAALRAGLVDRVVAYLAPMVLGAGTPTVADLGGCTLADAVRLQLDDVCQLGPDVRLSYRAERTEE
jgi:diaminohydroxyphosphoribosylaminopyrimidine deaminase/5-amino-6-(5-phosphoribosylamino)uracil reductase